MSFDTILIANRGEIALRIARTARRLGLGVVAVYSDADAEAPHVRDADLAVRLGAAEPASSYRNIAAILDACRRTGAQAVHPGYGFLSESAAFAEAVSEAGFTFIGPMAEVIDLMGNKARAKAAMQAAGVPTVPGRQGCRTDGEVIDAARQLGYPVLFKAAAGGGGRGMRVVRDEDSLLDLLRQARSEALSSFGSDELLIEKAIERGRHIEIQVLCDAHGTCLHLGERDCSLQRRFQKLVEEAPSPAVPSALRERMGEIARRACAAIGYTGVGTLEFLLTPDGDFYFMEMNTRLQVEHGVTELITGIDLVEQQIRVARGERLSFGQDDVAWKGHAIELRLCAEDPQSGFIPQVGRIGQWRPPDGVRVDAALEDGIEVTPYYDSMLGKILAWGETREQCIATLARACGRTALLGVPTNLHFLSRCIAHPSFRRGEITTDFLGSQDLTDDSWRPEPSVHAQIAAVLALAGIGSAKGSDMHLFTPAFTTRLRVPGGLPLVWKAAPAGNGWRLTRDDAADSASDHLVERFECSDECAVIVIDGLRRAIALHRTDDSTVWVQDGAAAWAFAHATIATAGDDAQERHLVAPLNGRVIAVLVGLGDAVAAQQPLIVIESMKMEISVAARADGRVGTVHVGVGDQVKVGQRLLEMGAS